MNFPISYRDNLLIVAPDHDQFNPNRNFKEDLLLECSKNNHTSLKIIINLCNLRQLTSSDLSYLIEIRESVMAYNHELLLSNLSKQISDLMDMTGLNTIFEVYSDI